MDRFISQEITLVYLNNGVAVLGQLLNVDAGAEAPAFCPDQDTADVLPLPQGGNQSG